ncbi:MAG: GNAT family N-acetyltransferase [Nitrospirota bacterium]
MTHTKVPRNIEGRGIGSRLVRGEFEIAQAQGLKVLPKCPFVKAFIDRHPEYSHLVQ